MSQRDHVARAKSWQDVSYQYIHKPCRPQLFAWQDYCGKCKPVFRCVEFKMNSLIVEDQPGDVLADEILRAVKEDLNPDKQVLRF